MEYYIYKDDQNLGPLSEHEVLEGLESGRFLPADLSCRVGEDRWINLDVFFPNAVNLPHSWMEPEKKEQPTQGTPPPVTSMPTVETGQWIPPQSVGYPAPVPQVQHVVHYFQEEPEGALPKVAMIGGIVVACMMVIGLVPCLGWLNWITLFSAAVVKVICWVAILTTTNKSARTKALIGLILVVITLFIGTIRLAVGGGCF